MANIRHPACKHVEKTLKAWVADPAQRAEQARLIVIELIGAKIIEGDVQSNEPLRKSD